MKEAFRQGLRDLGYVEGRNVVIANLVLELIGKSLEQLKQAVPGVSRVAVLWQPGALGERTERDMLKGAEVAVL